MSYIAYQDKEGSFPAAHAWTTGQCGHPFLTRFVPVVYDRLSGVVPRLCIMLVGRVSSTFYEILLITSMLTSSNHHRALLQLIFLQRVHLLTLLSWSFHTGVLPRCLLFQNFAFLQRSLALSHFRRMVPTVLWPPSTHM